jgi:hypothetical protein
VQVGRTKGRWKCQLRLGVINVEGRDLLFNKGYAEMEFK